MEFSNLTLEIFSKLEQKWLYHYDNSKKTRILSIDGGGTTGTVSGAALIHLEDQIRLKTGDSHSQITDFFDIVTGTGIGAIFAAMLTADDGAGRPMFTARDAVGFVTESNGELFKKHVGLFYRRRRFSGRSMEKVLKKMFTREDGKVLTLKDTCKPLLIPCFDLNSHAPFVFSRTDALESPSYDFELWKVCRATSATPGLFKPFPLNSDNGKTSCRAVDGGLVMNNPTAAAVTHVLHNKRDFPSVNGVDDLLVLSLGNGPSIEKPLKNLRRNNGEYSTSSVIGIVLDGVSETIDQMLGNAFCWNRMDYIRIQANGPAASKMDEVTKERGVESLPFGGKRLLTETNGERIDNFVQRLVALGRSSLPPSPCKETAISVCKEHETGSPNNFCLGRSSPLPISRKETAVRPLINGR